jgi:cell division protein FtsQ
MRAIGEGSAIWEKASGLVPVRLRRRFMRAEEAAKRTFWLDAALAGVVIVPSIFYGAALEGVFVRAGDNVARSISSGIAATGLAVSQVEIAGLKETYEQDVLDYLGVTDFTALPFFDVAAARERVEVLPWVKHASVKKFYPDRLHVELEEYEPYAIWMLGDRASIIDRDGVRITDRIDERFAGLPRVYGKDAAVEAAQLVDRLELYPVLRERYVMAEYVGGRRWTIYLKDDIAVHLPETGMDQALRTLTALENSHQLTNRDIEAIDLRLADRVMVRMSDDAAMKRNGKLKELIKASKRGGRA